MWSIEAKVASSGNLPHYSNTLNKLCVSDHVRTASSPRTAPSSLGVNLAFSSSLCRATRWLPSMHLQTMEHRWRVMEESIRQSHERRTNFMSDQQAFSRIRVSATVSPA
ncbi:hypothetical protein O3P69_008033 [Scylla paramamosain]|uniref:Uncharacterized protein n=1 Tax=Scylla paramamosain TaxID=85552 RepID=A0AAW0T0M8_SCYPA